MNNLGLKEKAALAMVGMIALYAIAVIIWFVNSEAAWKKSAKAYNRECERFAKEEKLIAEKRKWNDAYESEKAAMPTFEYGKATDTTWMSKVESIAKENLVLITQIDHGDEVEAGDVLELPIEVKNWEGSLEALVKFMHALENSDEGMFDVKAISLKPSNKKGYLKGSLSLTCAYMREE